MVSILDIQVSKWKLAVMLTKGGAPPRKSSGRARGELRLGNLALVQPQNTREGTAKALGGSWALTTSAGAEGGCFSKNE